MKAEGAHVSFELQPRLENQWIKLEPLGAGDFEALYAVASDPLIWEQHPSNDRYQREVFRRFFEDAIESGGAFRIHDNTNGTLIGSSRYYDLEESTRTVLIGYTFLCRQVWGGPYNRALKTLMLDHAFKFVDRAIFHVGATNFRSRRAMEKLGGTLIGEHSNHNVIYKIDKADWLHLR